MSPSYSISTGRSSFTKRSGLSKRSIGSRLTRRSMLLRRIRVNRKECLWVGHLYGFELERTIGTKSASPTDHDLDCPEQIRLGAPLACISVNWICEGQSKISWRWVMRCLDIFIPKSGRWAKLSLHCNVFWKHNANEPIFLFEDVKRLNSVKDSTL